MDIYQAIADGKYKNPDPCPVPPKRPDVLFKRVENLTTAEMKTLVKVTSAYNAEMTAYKIAKNAWNAKDNRVENNFEIDLATEYGMLNHPKRALLYSKAYDMGHSGGHEEVHAYYTDLLELVI